MIHQLPLAAVKEKYVEILLLEELATNSAVAAWILQYVGVSGRVTQASNSVWSLGREIDLLAIADGSIGIMIELKVASPLGFNQIEFYHEHGKKKVEQGNWTGYHVVICAPAAWFTRHGHSESGITYEQICAILRSNPGDRDSWRASVIEQAGSLVKITSPRAPRLPAKVTYRTRRGAGRKMIILDEAKRLLSSDIPAKGPAGKYTLRELSEATGIHPALILAEYRNMAGLANALRSAVLSDLADRLDALTPSGPVGISIMQVIKDDHNILIEAIRKCRDVTDGDAKLMNSLAGLCDRSGSPIESTARFSLYADVMGTIEIFHPENPLGLEPNWNSFTDHIENMVRIHDVSIVTDRGHSPG